MEKCLVVFSGGQDSTTCLFWAKKKFNEVSAITFDYGQRHGSELAAASEIAHEAGIEIHRFGLELLKSITTNSLTSNTLEIETEKPANRPPNTLVEGRNMLFLTYAAIFAKSKGIKNLVTGVGQADYSGYPDCRNEFILSLNQTINLSMEYDFKIHTPLMWKSKAEIWRMADELGIVEIIRDRTVTCYRGIPGSGCGNCPSCKLRKRGWEEYSLSAALDRSSKNY
jgi:7-cyano-7-deazaguanine synthase